MQRVNKFDFYTLAVKFAEVKALQGELDYRIEFYKLFGIRQMANDLVKKRPFLVGKLAVDKLSKAVTVIVPENVEEAFEKAFPNDGQAPPVPSWQVASVINAIKEFETILAAECQVIATYLVGKIGAYSTSDLVERATVIFGDVALLLPDNARADFDQAGRSLAFALPTAAAFHSLRGTESVIRMYYSKLVGSMPKQQARNWSAYVTQLRKCGAEESILAFIDHVRTSYRNPILHPEDQVNESQALILLGACVSLVTLILRNTETMSNNKARKLLEKMSG